MDVSSHEDSAGEFCYIGSTSSMKLLGFVSKAIKLLLTELVGQGRWQYIPLLPDLLNFYTGKAFDFPRLFFVYRSQSLFCTLPVQRPY